MKLGVYETKDSTWIFYVDNAEGRRIVSHYVDKESAKDLLKLELQLSNVRVAKHYVSWALRELEEF